MNDHTVFAVFLGALLSLYPARTSSLAEKIGAFYSDHESVYNVTTSIMDDVKESIFTIKLRCRGRTIDIVSCQLNDPQYQTIYHRSPCDKSIDLCTREHLQADNSYIGRFEIKYRASSVERLTVSSEKSLKQLSFYRIMAGHLFPGVDITGKAEGTYPLVEESIYGKCQSLVKIVRSRIKDESADNAKVIEIPGDENGNETRYENSKNTQEMLSIKRTRNLETCYPFPGLLIFDAFFYHPMMTSIHYDIKSSISRIIVRDRAFTSYTTEDIAMKNMEKPGGNTTMLHVRTTLTLNSIEPIDKPTPPIVNPISVKLPFVDGFITVKKNNDTDNVDNDHTSKMPQ